jgi:RimJ/RimL family protein N-acetyltransferase
VGAAALRDTRDLVGTISLIVARAHFRAELAYWVATHHWNRGYCTEAARVVVDFGFRHLKLHRIQGRHLVRNPPSGRVMQKIGMRHEGVQREAVLKWGRFEDAAVYAILASEWPDVVGTQSSPGG